MRDWWNGLDPWWKDFLTTAEKWDGVLPSTIPPNGTVPLLNLAQ